MLRSEIRQTRQMRRKRVPQILVVSGQAKELDAFEAEIQNGTTFSEALGGTSLARSHDADPANPQIYAYQGGSWQKAALVSAVEPNLTDAQTLAAAFLAAQAKNNTQIRRYRLQDGLYNASVLVALRRIIKARPQFASLDIYLDGIFRNAPSQGEDGPTLREPPRALRQATLTDFEQQEAFKRLGVSHNDGRPTGQGVTVVILDTSPAVEDVCYNTVDFWLDLSAPVSDFPAPLPYERRRRHLQTPVLASVPAFQAAQRNRYPHADDLDGPAMQPYHGMMIATLIRYLAPKTTIVLVKVLNEQGEGAGVALTNALAMLRYLQTARITANGRRVVEDKLVFNLSFGLFRTQKEEVDAAYMLATCDDICRSGAMMVVSSGNDSLELHPQNPQEPAAYGCFSDTPATNTNVIAVAATDSSDPGKRGSYAWFSNQSNLGAPGHRLVLDVGEHSRVASEPNSLTGDACRFIEWSGTSFAAPLVAGSAAVLLSGPKPIASNAIKQRIWKTAIPPFDWNGVAELNLKAALE